MDVDGRSAHPSPDAADRGSTISPEPLSTDPRFAQDVSSPSTLLLDLDVERVTASATSCLSARPPRVFASNFHDVNQQATAAAATAAEVIARPELCSNSEYSLPIGVDAHSDILTALLPSYHDVAPRAAHSRNKTAPVPNPRLTCVSAALSAWTRSIAGCLPSGRIRREEGGTGQREEDKDSVGGCGGALHVGGPRRRGTAEAEEAGAHEAAALAEVRGGLEAMDVPEELGERRARPSRVRADVPRVRPHESHDRVYGSRCVRSLTL